MNNKKSFGAILGGILGNVIVTCIFLCAVSMIIALTAKFIMWII